MPSFSPSPCRCAMPLGDAIVQHFANPQTGQLMAIKNLIAKGIGFTEVGEGVKWIPTHGLLISSMY